MDRTKYLQMCKDCAMIKEREDFGVIKNVPDRLRVIYNGIEYYPQSYELAFFKNGTVKHNAIIHDLKANAIVTAPLKDVFEKESNNE